MAFDKEGTRTPTSIGRKQLVITDEPVNLEDPLAMNYTVTVNFNNGETKTKSFNLRDHLTTAQINQLTNFMNTLSTKATTEIIG